MSTKVQTKRREVLYTREMQGNKIIAILFTRSLSLQFTKMDTKKSLFGSSFFCCLDNPKIWSYNIRSAKPWEKNL